jgi:hypothetical protein
MTDHAEFNRAIRRAAAPSAEPQVADTTRVASGQPVGRFRVGEGGTCVPRAPQVPSVSAQIRRAADVLRGRVDADEFFRD